MALPSVVRTPRLSDALDIPMRTVAVRTITPRRPIDRVRGEFIEMRGFSPTVQQAARLFDLPADVCHDVLTALEREGFLTCTPDGRYRLQGQA